VGQCGDWLEVNLQIDGERISQIKVRPHGCLYTMVCAEVMSKLALGKSLDEALQLEPEDVAKALGGLPEDHRHCARLAVNTLGEAVADFYQRHQAGLSSS
jgi:nitrogen fixation NifU-like protein